TVVNFTSHETTSFDMVDGRPVVTIEPSEGGPDVHVTTNPNGSTSVDVDGGATVTPPEDTDITVDYDGTSTDTESGGGPGPGPGDPGPGSGDSTPPYEPGHPNPLPQRDPLVLSLDAASIDLT